MKKIFALIIALATVSALFSATACKKADPAEISVYAPDGAPALAISKFISDKDDLGTGASVKYNVIAADGLQTVIAEGKADIVVMPVNLASKIYNSGDDPYKMAGVLTHGNLYVVAKEDVTLSSLVGKVVGVVNLTNVPGLTFKSILKANGIEYEDSDAAIEGKTALKGYDGAGLRAALTAGDIDVGVMPEPLATAITSSGKLKIALDVQALYDETAKAYPQAVVMIKSSVLKKYPSLANDFGTKVSGGIGWIKENPDKAASAIASVLAEGVTQSINAKNLNAKVVDNCKIYWQSATDAKADVVAYIERIRGIAPKAADAVSDDFFA